MWSHGTAHLRKSECGRDETSIPPGRSMLVGLFRVDGGRIDIVRDERFCHNIQLTSAGLGRRRWRASQTGHARVVTPPSSRLSVEPQNHLIWRLNLSGPFFKSIIWVKLRVMSLLIFFFLLHSYCTGHRMRWNFHPTTLDQINLLKQRTKDREKEKKRRTLITNLITRF